MTVAEEPTEEIVDWLNSIDVLGRTVSSLLPEEYDMVVQISHEESEGSLPPELARELTQVLRMHTSTPEDIWLCVWEGWGEWQLFSEARPCAPLARGITWFRNALKARQTQPRDEPTNRLLIPNREYRVFRGDVDDVAGSFIRGLHHQSASMWWPDDRAWFVATEVAAESTFVGCANGCGEQLVASLGNQVEADTLWIGT